MVAGYLTEERVEACALYWGTPEKERAETIQDYAKAWGISVAKLRLAKSDRRVMAKVEAQVKENALYLAVEAQSILADIMRDVKHRDRTKAVTRALDMGGFQTPSNPRPAAIGVTVNNNFPGEPEMDDEEIVMRAHNIIRGRGGPVEQGDGSEEGS